MNFNTLTEFVAHVAALPGTPNTSDYVTNWAGGTLEDSFRLAALGWPEGAEKAAKLATRIADRVVASVPADGPEIGYDVMGACYDPGAVAIGVPEAWSLVKPTGKRREVRICVNTSTSAGISTDVMIARGTAVAALGIALQTRGYAVSIDVGAQGDFGLYHRGVRTVYTRVADAGSGAPLDIDRIVFACAHPTFFRHMIHYFFSGTKSEMGGHTPTDKGTPECDLYLGGTHLHQVERWRDGGEAWVIAEYIRQTGKD